MDKPAATAVETRDDPSASPPAPNSGEDGKPGASGDWPVAPVARSAPQSTSQESMPGEPRHGPPLAAGPPPLRTDGPVAQSATTEPSTVPPRPEADGPRAEAPPPPIAPKAPSEEPSSTEPASSTPQTDPSAPTVNVPPPRASQRPPPLSVRPAPPSTATSEATASTVRQNSRVADDRPSAGAVASAPSRPSEIGAPSTPAGQPELELDRARRALDHSRQALGRAEQKIKDLTKETEALRDRAKQTERALDRKMEELEKFVGQHESLRSLLAVRAERIRELEVALADQQRDKVAEGERLAADHDRKLAALEDQMNRRLSDQMLIVADLRAQITRFGTAQKVTDDLVQVRGIGPAYARKLHAIGVRSFAQIASWSEADIDDMAAKLKIHGARIRRADWVASARELLGQPAASPDDAADEPAGELSGQSDDSSAGGPGTTPAR